MDEGIDEYLGMGDGRPAVVSERRRLQIATGDDLSAQLEAPMRRADFRYIMHITRNRRHVGLPLRMAHLWVPDNFFDRPPSRPLD